MYNLEKTNPDFWSILINEVLAMQLRSSACALLLCSCSAPLHILCSSAHAPQHMLLCACFSAHAPLLMLLCSIQQRYLTLSMLEFELFRIKVSLFHDELKFVTFLVNGAKIWKRRWLERQEREREKVATCVASFPGRPKRLSDYEKIREMKSLF